MGEAKPQKPTPTQRAILARLANGERLQWSQGIGNVSARAWIRGEPGELWTTVPHPTYTRLLRARWIEETEATINRPYARDREYRISERGRKAIAS